jgi:hypothetical protein
VLQPSQPYWLHHSNNIWWRVQIMKLLMFLFSLLSCYSLSFGSKDSPQNSVLKRILYILFSVGQKGSVTQTQNCELNYSSLYLNLYTVRWVDMLIK